MKNQAKKDNSLIYGVIGIVFVFLVIKYVANSDWYLRLQYGSISECIGKKQSQFGRTLNEMDEKNLADYPEFLEDENAIDRLAEKQCRKIFKK